MIKVRMQKEMAKHYDQEIQSLCKTPAFGLVKNSESSLGIADQHPLNDIAEVGHENAPLLSSIVKSVGVSSQKSSSSLLVSMKMVAILAILCRSAHRNNSNYIPLLVAIYMYSAGARVDAITLLNHLGLSVSYDVLQRQLRHITDFSRSWIKSQSSNRRLVGSWDNFEFHENVHGERTGDTVKFRSVTMALWIQQGWRIPDTGLQQSMWDPKKEVLSVYSVVENTFGLAGTEIRNKCQRIHRFNSFRTAFPSQEFSYRPSMPVIDLIDCKREGSTKAFPFAPSMFSEGSIAGNMSVYEDLAFGVLVGGLICDDNICAKSALSNSS